MTTMRRKPAARHAKGDMLILTRLGTVYHSTLNSKGGATSPPKIKDLAGGGKKVG